MLLQHQPHLAFPFGRHLRQGGSGCQLRGRGTGEGQGGSAPTAPAGPGSHLQEDGVGHGGVGVDDDGGGLVVPDLLEERGGVPGVIQHPD